jgi:hypothetical protein
VDEKDPVARCPLGARSSELGARSSELAASIDDPQTWLLVIERCSQRCCAAHDRDAVIGAVTLEVTKVWLAGRPVRSFWGW